MAFANFLESLFLSTIDADVSCLEFSPASTFFSHLTVAAGLGCAAGLVTTLQLNTAVPPSATVWLLGPPPSNSGALLTITSRHCSRTVRIGHTTGTSLTCLEVWPARLRATQL